MINKTSILLINDNLQAIANITEKCLEAGIEERNIFSINETESTERYLEIAGISYVIIDANMYNYLVAETINKFSEYFPIQTIIIKENPEQKTLRMLNDKSLSFVNSIDEIPDILIGKTRKTHYSFANSNNY